MHENMLGPSFKPLLSMMLKLYAMFEWNLVEILKLLQTDGQTVEKVPRKLHFIFSSGELLINYLCIY